MIRDFTVSLPAGGTTTARHYPRHGDGEAATSAPDGALLAFAHGAGAGHDHPFIAGVADGLAARGVDVVTFNFLYSEQKRRVPDRTPALELCFRAVIDTVRADRQLRQRRLFIGGKSMGGRMATHLAAQGGDDLCGVIVIGYPLHPPGKPGQPRVAHLPAITCPVLIVQGERDPFGTASELESARQMMPAPVTLRIVAGGDHSLAVRGRPRHEVLDAVLPMIAEWMTRPEARPL